MKVMKKYKAEALDWFLRGGWVREYFTRSGGYFVYSKIIGTIGKLGLRLYTSSNKSCEYVYAVDPLPDLEDDFAYSKYRKCKAPPGFSNLELTLIWSPKYEPIEVPANPRTKASKKTRSGKVKRPSRNAGGGVRKGNKRKSKRLRSGAKGK